MTDDKLIQRSIYFSNDEWAALKVMAKEEDQSANHFMRQLLKYAIADRAAQTIGLNVKKTIATIAKDFADKHLKDKQMKWKSTHTVKEIEMHADGFKEGLATQCKTCDGHREVCCGKLQDCQGGCILECPDCKEA